MVQLTLIQPDKWRYRFVVLFTTGTECVAHILSGEHLIVYNHLTICERELNTLKYGDHFLFNRLLCNWRTSVIFKVK